MNYNGEECYGVIYTITHVASGKKYVGQTTNVERRRAHYRTLDCKKQIRLYNALKKHGVDSFSFEVTYVAYDKAQMDWLERWFIEDWDTINNGYNCKNGGANGKPCAETLKKMSEVQYRRYEDPEAREKLSAAQRKRYKDNPEVRAKMREAQRKHYEDPEARRKLSTAQRKRYKENPESRKKIGDAIRKHYEDPEARRKRSTAQRKRYEDPEMRKKMSDAMYKRYEGHPEAREKTSVTTRKHHEDHPETREKMSAAMLKHYKNNPEAREKKSIALKERWRKRKLATAQSTQRSPDLGSQIIGETLT